MLQATVKCRMAAFGERSRVGGAGGSRSGRGARAAAHHRALRRRGGRAADRRVARLQALQRQLRHQGELSHTGTCRRRCVLWYTMQLLDYSYYIQTKANKKKKKKQEFRIQWTLP